MVYPWTTAPLSTKDLHTPAPERPPLSPKNPKPGVCHGYDPSDASKSLLRTTMATLPRGSGPQLGYIEAEVG